VTWLDCANIDTTMMSVAAIGNVDVPRLGAKHPFTGILRVAEYKGY
jgi:hypothetical protein